jgi:hypothetical protein
VARDTVAWMAAAAAAGPPTVPALAFIHIPIPQFRVLWNCCPVNGSRMERVNCPSEESGAFQALRWVWEGGGGGLKHLLSVVLLCRVVVSMRRCDGMPSVEGGAVMCCYTAGRVVLCHGGGCLKRRIMGLTGIGHAVCWAHGYAKSRCMMRMHVVSCSILAVWS